MQHEINDCLHSDMSHQQFDFHSSSGESELQQEKVRTVGIKKSLIRKMIMPVDKQAHSGEIPVTSLNIWAFLKNICTAAGWMYQLFQTLLSLFYRAAIVFSKLSDLTYWNVSAASGVVLTGASSLQEQNFKKIPYFLNYLMNLSFIHLQHETLNSSRQLVCAYI